MECKDILNLIAIIVIPIAAVLIGQWLQSGSEKRKDKMQIFKILMTSRIYGWTQDSVHCMNIIDIVFADDKTVCEAWKDLHDKYCVQNPDETQLRKIQNAQYKLLETMAKSLGYKDAPDLPCHPQSPGHKGGHPLPSGEALTHRGIPRRCEP